ncbi:MAG: sigma 54-interacting transcriptional regulator [Nitrospirae bacterium YQR-1]
MQYAKELTVLYVEDNNSIREDMTYVLGRFFSLVTTATNGKDAVDMYQLQKYDLIISDIRMPVMDGIEMTKEIKKINKEQVIIITSAHDEARYLLDLTNLGIDKFVMKPIDNKTFLKTVAQSCRHITYEREIQRYKTNTEAIFRSVGEAIITVDNDMKIINANNAVKTICGKVPENIIGNDFNSVFSTCTNSCCETLAETMRDGEPSKKSRLECCQSHKTSVVNVTTYPLLGNNGKHYGAVMVIRDDTYTSMLETELKQRREYHKLVGKSEAMQKVYSLIQSLAVVKTTVVITGESGTGKELVAEAIHYTGERGGKPLVKVNCSALSEGLLESELFGHVKGAFTGALKDKTGRFQMAEGGTIFLDEIGDMSLNTQLRLLRVLQEFEFERVGDSIPVKSDVRVLAATNQDLKRKVVKGEFREDLYYRINVMELHIPPLRERLSDIHSLVSHFLDKFNLRFKKNIQNVSADVMKRFMGHRWAGNVRELEHAMEHAFVLCDKPVITVDDLPANFKERAEIIENTPEGFLLPDERNKIIQALEQSRWKKNKAAELLGVSRVTLYEKMKKHNIK